jgi:hypothetical protein
MRRFNFEAEVYETLSCVPMAVRRKLDRAGVKIGLKQWQALGRGERLAICHLPADTSDQVDALKLFILEAVARGGTEPTTLSEADRAGAEPPPEPPTALVDHAGQLGFALDRSKWQGLDGDERYALMKLGAGPKLSHNLKAALREFLSGHAC